MTFGATRPPLIGNLGSTTDRLRGRAGRFERHPRCDGCGLPCTEHYTDDRVCKGGDGPGFYLCNRVACVQTRARVEASGGLAALLALYEAQRRRNDHAQRSGRTTP